MNYSIRFNLSALAAAFLASGPLTSTANAASILLVDDSRGLSVQPAWTTTLINLGHSVAVEAIPSFGNPSSNFSNYDLIIWTVGDRAYENLTVANWSKMTQYSNSGGKLIYAGGHSVYEEHTVGHASIEAFFGVTNTQYNMPMWGLNTTITGTGNSPVFGAGTFSIVQDWAGGEYGDMFSGFGVSTATALVNRPVGTDGPYIMAQNAADSAQLWGFDLNHVAPSDRSAILSKAINSLSAVPEPGSILSLGGLLSAGLLLRTRRTPR